MMSGGRTSGRIESSWPNLTKVGPSSSRSSRRCLPRSEAGALERPPPFRRPGQQVGQLVALEEVAEAVPDRDLGDLGQPAEVPVLGGACAMTKVFHARRKLPGQDGFRTLGAWLKARRGLCSTARWSHSRCCSGLRSRYSELSSGGTSSRRSAKCYRWVRSSLWLELIRQRQYGVIGQALAGALLLLIAVVLAALLLPGPWVWIVFACLLLGFFGLALRIRAGRARAL